MPQPKLDEDLVQRLAKIAARLDGGDELADASLLAEFNELASTDIPFSEFRESTARKNTLIMSVAC